MEISSANGTVRFGQFQLDARRRTLLARGCPVKLHGRAFDVLALLLASRDRVVHRDEILAQVWRGLVVGENNLTVQVSALRRALAKCGETGLIVTVAGRGYRFVGDVIESSATVPCSEQHTSSVDGQSTEQKFSFPGRLTSQAVRAAAAMRDVRNIFASAAGWRGW